MLLNTATVSGLTILAKIAGAFKTVVLARYFGPGSDLDLYLVAFLFPSLLTDVFCGALVPALVPRLVGIRRESHRSMVVLYTRVLWQSLLLFTLAGILLALAAAMSAAMFAPLPRQVGALVAIMAPVVPISAVANIWRAVLNANQKFAAAAATPVLTPVAIVASLILAGHSVGVWPLALGTTLGAAAEAFVLGTAVMRAGIPALPRWSAARPDTGNLQKEYGYLVASSAATGGIFFVNQSMAAMLGPGNISIFNFGTRLSTVLVAIGPAALSVAALPRFSQLAAERDWDGFKRISRVLLLGFGIATAAVTVLLIWFSQPIVRLAFERGAFTPADTAAVSVVQAYALIQLPFVFGIAILTRIVISLRANRVLLPLSVATLLSTAALNRLMVRELGVAGIAFSSSLVQALAFAALLVVVFSAARRWFLKES